MNAKQKKTRVSKVAKQKLALREELWPGVESRLWSRKEHDGFITVPRTMPLLMNIMDDLSPKGKPVSSTYLSLWCRVFDESVVTVTAEYELALEAGFTGQRAVSTWVGRIKILEELGFISVKPGPKGERNYILLFNPYLVVKEHNAKGGVQEQKYIALIARMQEIGANDFSSEP